MREIKFRAWDNCNKQMLKIFDLTWEDWGSIVIHGWTKDDEVKKMKHSGFELMQYTGLKDKNGNEIYEGDIYKLKNELGFIEYNKDSMRFLLHSISYDDDFIGSFRYENIEIIGNIHENKKLLEEFDD